MLAVIPQQRRCADQQAVAAELLFNAGQGPAPLHARQGRARQRYLEGARLVAG